MMRARTKKIEIHKKVVGEKFGAAKRNVFSNFPTFLKGKKIKLNENKRKLFLSVAEIFSSFIVLFLIYQVEIIYNKNKK